ncbi:MAG: hypothetical protein U0893_25070 [Chloroflexota bacterium]
MRLRGALLWEADGEARRDEVLISDERPNGANAKVVILDPAGQPRATSPADLPDGSVLLLPHDASDGDVDRLRHSGYAACRDDEDGDMETGRAAAIAAADAELDEVIERLTRVLQQRHPDLFDSDGNLLEQEYAKKMLKATGGRRFLSGEELIALTDPGIKAWSSRKPADAP